MKAVVIGATGHVGSYLVTRLVREGYDVTAVARGGRKAYTASEPEWNEVEIVTADRKTFCSSHINADVVCDLIAYTVAEAESTVKAMSDSARLIQIGSIWVYGHKLEVPVSEGHPENDTTHYGIGKAAIEKYLMRLTAENKLACTVIHPGHISGRGWLPINPQGNLNMAVYENIYNGRPILLPNQGENTLHHVHSSDIAGLIASCLKQPDKSIGQVFHSVTAKALTLRGFAEGLYAHYGYEPAIEYAPWDKFKMMVSETDADITFDHIRRSPVCSMEKAEKLLGFVPEYTSMETVIESLDWQVQNDFLKKIK